MERRTLFTVGTLSGGILTATGTSGADQIVLDLNPTDSFIRVRNLSTAETQTFDPSTVTSIKVNLLDGDDSLSVADAVGKSVTVDGGTGTDALHVTTPNAARTETVTGTSVTVGSLTLLTYDATSESLSLETGSAADTTYVTGSAATTPLTITTTGGADVVVVGNSVNDPNSTSGNARSVAGTVTVVNAKTTGNRTALYIDDAADAVKRTVAVSATTVTGVSVAAVNFTGADLSSLNVRTGSAGNTYSVSDTPTNVSLPPTTLRTGTGVDTVGVAATTGPLLVEGDNAADVVNLGASPGGARSLNGSVVVQNSGSLGFTTVNLTDAGDSVSRNVTIDTYTDSNSLPRGRVTGLAPASIEWVGPDTAAANVSTGAAADAVTVKGTVAGVITNVSSTGGNDAVTIGGSTTGAAPVRGSVNVLNTAGTTTLSINDTGDTLSRFATIDTYTPSGDTLFGRVTGLAVGDIAWRNANVASTINVTGPNVFTSYTVAANPAGKTLVLNSGTDSDNITVGGTAGTLNLVGHGGFDSVLFNTDAGTLAGVTGNVTISNTGTDPETYLGIYDANDTTKRTVTLTPTQFTGVTAGTIDFSAAHLYTYYVTLGSAGNTLNVTGTPVPDGIGGTVVTGAGNDVATVTAMAGDLGIDGGGGTDIVNVGTAASGTAGITGVLDLSNNNFNTAVAQTSVVIDTTSISTDQSVTIDPSYLAGLTAQPVTYVESALASVTIKTGAGNDTVDLRDGFGADVRFEGNAGNDTFISENSGTGPVNFFGGTGHDLLDVAAGDVVMTSDADSTSTDLSVHVEAGARVDFQATQHLGTLTVDSGATAYVDDVTADLVLVVSSLQIDGTLDLADNDMVLAFAHNATFGGQLPVDYVASTIFAGYDSASWDMPGIVSKTAAATGGRTSLGYVTGQEYIELNDPGVTFDGLAVTADMVIVKYTWAGDANLDGIEDTADLSRLAAAFSSNRPAPDWISGDFNFDRTVDTADLSILAGTLNNFVVL